MDEQEPRTGDAADDGGEDRGDEYVDAVLPAAEQEHAGDAEQSRRGDVRADGRKHARDRLGAADTASLKERVSRRDTPDRLTTS